MVEVSCANNYAPKGGKSKIFSPFLLTLFVKFAMVSVMKKKTPTRTKMTAKEFADTSYQVYNELVNKGFTTEQAMRLTIEVVRAIVN